MTGVDTTLINSTDPQNEQMYSYRKTEQDNNLKHEKLSYQQEDSN